LSDETTQDSAAAPVDQAPAQASPAVDPALVSAVAGALIGPLKAALVGDGPPAAASAPVDQGPAAASGPANAAAVDQPAASYKPGSLAIYEHDHFGKTKRQIMLVVGVYDEQITDPRTGAVTGTQPRLRMLPIGAADAYADLPADELVPADSFDWEAAA
jgi:hypothetical protein